MPTRSPPKIGTGPEEGRRRPRRTRKLKEKKATPAALRLSVLLVDDDANTLEMYERFLKWRNHRVVTAEDGVAALQAVLYERFDIVVLDLAMPRVNGLEVLESLRRDARTRTTPVLVLSGQSGRERAMKTGADAYFEKPCVPATLLVEIERTIAASMRRPR